MLKNRIRLLKANGTTVKLTAVKGTGNHKNDIIRVQAANGENGFFKGPEIPANHLNAFIGHLMDLKAELENMDVEFETENSTDPNSFHYDEEIPKY